jgi:pyruvate formate lyase activating enzyme
MRIGGLKKCSLIDFPGVICAVVFTQGCNFRCPYCHNASLVLPERFQEPLDSKTIVQFLSRRKNQLDGVVISGGEPTLQSDLVKFIYEIKELGYLIKLDTNGSRPDVLNNLFVKNLVDFVAMDIKAPLEKYQLLSGASPDQEAIKESIRLIYKGHIVHQFRTTFAEPLLEKHDLDMIRKIIEPSPLHVQDCQWEHALNPNLNFEIQQTLLMQDMT